MAMATTMVKSISDGHVFDHRVSRYAAEVEGATNRFAAARALFKVQAASSPQAPPPIAWTSLHSRLDGSISAFSTTATSLHKKVDGAISVAISVSSIALPQNQITSESDHSCLSAACMRGGSRQIPRPTIAPKLASSTAPLTPVNEGCILLGPRRTLQPLDVTRQITARTTTGAPAWYCRHDKLVVFEGYHTKSDGLSRPLTKSSRGLALARRKCPEVQISIDIPCTHCQDLLKRQTWVFEERMLEGNVCKNCQERCAVEHAKHEAHQREMEENEEHTSFGHDRQDTGADFEIEMEKEMQKVAAAQPNMRVVTGEDGRPAFAPTDPETPPAVFPGCRPRARADARYKELVEENAGVVFDREGRAMFAPVDSGKPLTIAPGAWPLKEEVVDLTKRDSVLHEDEDQKLRNNA